MVARDTAAAPAPPGSTGVSDRKPRRPPPRRRQGRRVGTALAVAAPWSWFVVRDWGDLADAAAIGLPVVTVAALGLLLFVALVARPIRRASLLSAASVLAVGLVAVVAPWTPERAPAPTSPVRVTAANVFLENPRPAEAAASILAQDAGVVISIETGAQIRAVLDAAYPYAASTGDGDGLAEVIHARWPITGAGPLQGDLAPYGLRAVVERPEGRLVVYAVHLPRPWFDNTRYSQTLTVHRALVAQLHDLVEKEVLPTVVGGDLNLVDRTSGYRQLDASLRDAVRSEWTGPTSLKRRLRFLLGRIDHIFVTDEWCARDGARYTVPGSDHRAVTAAVGPCQAPGR